MATSIHNYIAEHWLRDKQECKFNRDDNPAHVFTDGELVVRSRNGTVFLSEPQDDGTTKDYHTIEELEEAGIKIADISFHIQLIPR